MKEVSADKIHCRVCGVTFNEFMNNYDPDATEIVKGFTLKKTFPYFYAKDDGSFKCFDCEGKGLK